MPPIIRRCDRLAGSGGRHTTRSAGNSFRQIATNVAPDPSIAHCGPVSPVMRHAAFAVGLLLAACAAPGSVGSSPYHVPNDLDIGHAGGGGGGGGGGGSGGM